MPYPKVIQRKGKSHIFHIKNEAINIWMHGEYKLDLEDCVAEALKRHRESLIEACKPKENYPPMAKLEGIWCQDADGWFRIDE